MITVVVRAVYDGDKAGSSIIYQGSAPKGALIYDTLDAVLTDLDKPGYILDKYYRWDWYGHKFGKSDTFNGWTNVYVTYTTDPDYNAGGVYVKESGAWIKYSKVFRKEGWNWVEYASLEDVYDTSKGYVRVET